MIKRRTSIISLMAAITGAMMFASLSYAAPGDGTGDGSDSGNEPVENPYIEENAKRIKPGYPLGTMAQWLATPDEYALDPINIRAGKHPDRSDPNGGPYDVVYIFPDEASANAWWNPIVDPDGMPTTIPDTAVAFIHWELDNQSGTFPGVMSYSDIDGFKSRNCIMASGATIPQPGTKDGIPKDCSNPQGSSKRFKMNVLIPDVPIDLVYNVETHPLTYFNYETPPLYDGLEDVGRIYRLLQKWHNATGMDTAGGARDGVRISGFSLELGSGIGNNFTAIPNANDPGLDPDKVLGFELRPCMQDHFLDIIRNPSSLGKNPCTIEQVQDSTGQDLRQEIWLEEEYSTFSPKMYSFNTDKRTTPVGGWWDKRPAGIYPPAVQTLGKLDSGTAPSESTTYFDDLRVDGALPLPGYFGGTTPNYFDIVETQIANNTTVTGINIPNPFGYLMYFGVLSEGDRGIIAQGVYADEDGDPATEGDLVAWWDGDEYRWGSDPDVNGEIDGDAFAVVPRETLVEWAMFPLQEEPDPDTGEFPTGPLYEIGLMDDMAGLNIDSFVYLGRNFTGDQFTIRLTAEAIAVGDQTGNLTPAWVDSPAEPLTDSINNDGVIIIRPEGVAGDPLLVLLGDIIVGNLPTVVVENLRTNETENITLSQDPDELRKFSASLPTAANGNVGGNNDGTLNVWPLDLVQVTYIDEVVEAPAIGPVTRTDVAEIPLQTLEPVIDDGGSSGCSCSYSPDGSYDPILPAAVLFALGYLGLRRRESRSK